MVQDSPRSFLMLLWNSLSKPFQSSRPVQIKQFKQSTTVFRYYLSIASRGYILPSLMFV